MTLPSTRDLKLAYVTSIIVAALMTIVSLVSLFYSSDIYRGVEAKMLPLFVGQDALNLVVCLPLLIGSMWLASRGAMFGLLLWPGALFYVLYDYGYYALGAPFNAFFVPYLVLMTLSAYALIGLVASINPGAVRDRLAGAVPPRIVGGFLAGIALLFIALWTGLSLSALASGSPLDQMLRVVTTLDFTIQLPALLVGGILLWRRHPLGYLAAPGLLLQAVAYLVGLSAITVLQERVIQLPFDPVAVVPGLIVGAIGLVLMAPFVRGAGGADQPIGRTTVRSVAPAVTR